MEVPTIFFEWEARQGDGTPPGLYSGLYPTPDPAEILFQGPGPTGNQPHVPRQNQDVDGGRHP